MGSEALWVKCPVIAVPGRGDFACPNQFFDPIVISLVSAKWNLDKLGKRRKTGSPKDRNDHR